MRLIREAEILSSVEEALLLLKEQPGNLHSHLVEKFYAILGNETKTLNYYQSDFNSGFLKGRQLIVTAFLERLLPALEKLLLFNGY